jgi:hypothetical protein
MQAETVVELYVGAGPSFTVAEQEAVQPFASVTV